ncbi:MAG: NAD-dependent epimerase/dehydratase family protein [Bacteriovoracaceae bacterium]
MKRVLITGGAGFVGSSLAKMIKADNPQSEVWVLDNLKRRGSELNLPTFAELGINFVHGDIRDYSDFENLNGDFDLLIEASAEPSVHSGISGGLSYLVDTNLSGTLNCLRFARERCEKTLFLSTSRVYSIDALREIELEENETRFQVKEGIDYLGLRDGGILENFDVSRFRSFYGTTKLSSEYFIQEYVETFGLKAIINRCGVIAGPGQFGKVDQGVFTLWVANHYFKKSLKYMGFGGKGLQVRDLLHPRDLYNLILAQVKSNHSWNGEVYNVGGGLNCSTSLLEYTKLAEEITGNKIEIASAPETAKVDIPYYVTNTDKAEKDFDWKVSYDSKAIVQDIFTWMNENEALVSKVFN